MARPTGLQKTGGRKSGTPNKKTLVLKDVIDSIGIDVPRRIVELLPELEKEKQVDVLLELMSYIYPKRKAIEHSSPEGRPIHINQTNTQIKAIISNPDAFAAVLQLERVLHGTENNDSD